MTSAPLTAAPTTRKTGLARYALPLLLLGAAAIACSPIFVRLSELGPIATAVYRVLFALPALALFQQVVPQERLTAKPTLKDWPLLALAGFMFAGDLATWHWSIGLTSVANATLLANFAPIFVTLGSWLLFGERFSKLFLAGLALSMLGAITLMGSSLNLGPQHLYGDLLGLGCGGFYGGYILSIAKLRARFDTLTVMLWSGLVTFLLLLPLSWIQGESLIAPSLYGWLILVGLALISHAGGQSLIAFSLAHLPAAFSSVVLLMQPVIAAILAVIVLGELPVVWQIVGGLIVLVGIYTAKRGSIDR
jgi:drug/metabolite transporter (DMT)-like permease